MGNYNKNKKKYRGKGRKDSSANSTPSPQTKDIMYTDMERVQSNNISWWNKSVTYGDSVRVPFNIIPGYVYRDNLLIPAGSYLDPGETKSALDDVYATSLPGVMAIDYVPFTGPAENWNDPLNKSWMSIFSSYASKTSGTFQVQQADLALVGEAANSIVTLIYEVKRALKLSHTFSNLNQFFPKALIKACGIDPDSVIGKQDEIRRVLNYYISAFNSLNLPGYTDVHLRRAQLAHNVYADQDDIKAQFTLFRTSGYYKYIDIADDISDAEHLKWIPFYEEENRSIQVYLDAIAEQVNALRDSASFGLVSAAVLRAFGDRQLLKIELAVADEILVPVPDRIMNYQIQNATFVSNLDMNSLHVTQNVIGNALTCMPKLLRTETGSEGASTIFDDTFAVMLRHKMLNSFDGIINDEFVMEATRLMVASSASEDPEFSPYLDQLPLDYCGTEICQRYTIYKMTQVNSESAPVISQSPYLSSVGYYEYDQATSIANKASELSVFRNHPYHIAVVNADDYVTRLAIARRIGDVFAYTYVGDDTLRGLHDAALQSIYTLNPAIEVGNKM